MERKWADGWAGVAAFVGMAGSIAICGDGWMSI